MPAVFNMSIAINQNFWSSFAAFQRAILFQTNSHSIRMKSRDANWNLFEAVKNKCLPFYPLENILFLKLNNFAHFGFFKCCLQV